MVVLTWILSVVFVVGGVFSLFRRQWIWGTVSILIGLALGSYGFFV